MGPFLDRLPILHTRDIEKTRAYLAGKAIGLHVLSSPDEPGRMDTWVNGVALASLWIGYIQYGAQVNVTVVPESSNWLNSVPHPASPDRSKKSHGDYWVHFPLQGVLTTTIAGEEIECDARCGVISSPTEPHVLRVSSATTRLSLEIRGDVLQHQLATLLGDSVSTPILFSPALPLGAGDGRSLAGFLRCAANEIDRDGPHWSAHIAAQFEQFMMTALLLSQPHNYTRVLRLRERPIAPRDVRRVIEYIHENLAEAIALADLVAVSGVAGRTLLKHFREFKGVSPMRYIRNLRLARVRDELTGADARQVLEVATRWGFTHAGRFAVDYRQRFGESPSATLESRRRRSA